MSCVLCVVVIIYYIVDNVLKYWVMALAPQRSETTSTRVGTISTSATSGETASRMFDDDDGCEDARVHARAALDLS